MATAQKAPPPISPAAQESLVRYAQEALRMLGQNYNLRSRMQQIDRQYQREADYSEAQQRARRANENGDATKMQNVVVPVVMPQVESLLAELANLFGFAGYPLFPVFSKPIMEPTALMLETTIGEQGVRFGWAAELLQCFRDGLKYNLMAAEVDWQVKKVYSVANDAVSNIKVGTAQETLYEGNAIKRRDPYNLILDTRVPPYEQHTRGEYVGYVEVIGMMELKQRLAEMNPLDTMNAKAAFESGNGAISTVAASDKFFIPQVNPNALVDVTSYGTGSNINWFMWAGLEKDAGIQYSDMYEIATLYARILPSMHKIYGKNSNTPQIWKFIVINRQVCVYARRQDNAHNFLPIIVAQASEDGLGWQAKSFADHAMPYQQLATSLYNSAITSQRRKVYDRIFYDPTRINKADIDKTDPVARIPVKSEAYGKPIGDAYSVAPYRDEQVPEILNFAQNIAAMADIATGQNRVQQGQFQKGNKTRTEFQTVMDKSDARPLMTAIVLENRFFTPLKLILKMNTLQYQPPVNLFNRNTKQQVQVDPVQLRQVAPDFRMADGLMPTDAYVNLELFQGIMQMVAQNPQMAMNWDIPGMIMYWLRLEGATWIDDFKIQQPTTAMPGAATPGATPTPQPGANGASPQPQPGATGSPQATH